MLLTLDDIIERQEKHRCISDERRRTIYVLASYIGEDGYEYRKSFESYNDPVVPKIGTHKELNGLAIQF